MIEKNREKYVFKRERAISSMGSAFNQKDKEQFNKNIKVLAKR